jgi:hypothetical protein
MSTWTGTHSVEESHALERYTPKDITNAKDFNKEIQSIDRNQALNMVDKYKYKKQLMRTVFLAKQQEINHHLDSFENYLVARKDVESKTIALEAQKAIMVLEREQLDMMKNMGLSHSSEISDTLIKSGTMLTAKLEEVAESKMESEIKVNVIKSIRIVWEKTNCRIMESVDTYMEELSAKEKARI